MRTVVADGATSPSADDMADKDASKWDEVDHFVDAATHEILNYEVKDVVLNTDKITALDGPAYALDWKSVPFGDSEIEDVPNDKRGVYAFVVARPKHFLPAHGYIMYIGIAGRNSDRPLRERYRDYLNPNDVIDRPRIARMISRWGPILRFHFAAIDDDVSTEELQNFEIRLNTAFLPPCAKGDIEADTKKKRAAFK